MVEWSRIYRKEKKNYKKPSKIKVYCIDWLTILVICCCFISEGTSGLRYGRCHIVNKSRLPHCHPLKIVTDQLEFSSFFVHYTSKSSKFTRLRNMNNILKITTTSIFHVQTPMRRQFIKCTLKFTSVTTLICRFECSKERSEIECHFDKNAHTSK